MQGPSGEKEGRGGEGLKKRDPDMGFGEERSIKEMKRCRREGH